MIFEALVNQILNEQVEGVTELAQQFYDEFLSKYQPNEVGSHNCAWATEQFIKWAKGKGIDAKAIYFVWPKEEKVAELKKAGVLGSRFADAGESHIAPVVKGKIIDFTYKQFDNNFNQPAKITDVNSWQNVYGKYGYGSRAVNVGGKSTPVVVDSFDKIKNIKEIGGISTIYPSKPLDKPLASRVSIGSDEVRNIAKTGKVTSRGPYGGHTFFGTKGEENFPSNMKGLWYSHGTEGPFKPGQKAGYVLRGDPSKMQTPGVSVDPETMGVKDPAWYKEKGYVALPPGSEASNIKTIQRIKQPSTSWSEPGVLGKERDFNKFMQIYNKLQKAYARAGIRPNPKIGTPRPGMGLAGIAAINAALMDELPANIKLGFQTGGGTSGAGLPPGARVDNAKPYPSAY